MGKFKTRIEGTPNQIGQKYQERDAAYPYGTKRHASGADLPAQTRSVDSMKSMSIPENQYQVQLSELNHTYLDGKIDQATYEKSRTIMTNHWLIHHEALTSEQAIGEALVTQGYQAAPSSGTFAISAINLNSGKREIASSGLTAEQAAKSKAWLEKQIRAGASWKDPEIVPGSEKQITTLTITAKGEDWVEWRRSDGLEFRAWKGVSDQYEQLKNYPVGTQLPVMKARARNKMLLWRDQKLGRRAWVCSAHIHAVG